MPTQRQLDRYTLGRQPSFSGGGYPSGGGRLIDLVMRQGEQQAEGARAQGEIWGNAVSQAGQQISGALQQHQEEKKLKKRDEAWLGILNDPEIMKDPRRAYAETSRVWGPDKAGQMFQGLVAVHQLGQPKRDPQMDQQALGAAANAYLHAGPGLRAMTYNQLRSIAGNANPQLLQVLPEQYDMRVDSQIVEPFAKQYAPKPEKRSTKVVADTLVDDQTGEELYKAPPGAPKAETRGLDVQAADALARGDTETYNRLLKVKKEMGQADDRPRITVNAGPGGSNLSPTAESNIINRLSTQWDRASKTAVELDRQSKLMDSGLAAARRGDMAAGSQAVLVTFQKILDPTSVVRESEYARSAEGQSLLNRMEGAYERLASGGAGVPLDELEAYSKLAKEMTSASTGHLRVLKERLGKTADRYKIPRDLVIDDSMTPAESGGGPAAERLTKEQYDAAPSGTQYIAPDGTLKRKR